MMQISKEPAFIRNINFGKYAGYLLTDIAKEDRGYLEWMLKQYNRERRSHMEY
jgi:exodeoxyribonuclease X